MNRFSLIVILTIIIETVITVESNFTSELLTTETGTSKILSRSKRFLIFPEASSFQLVFCTQNHGYLQIGDIVWFGNTAALAWVLPSDPKLFYLIKEHKHEHLQSRQDNAKNIYYLDEDGKIIAKVPYHRKLIVNPAFAKRSTDEESYLIKNINISNKQRFDAHTPTNFRDIEEKYIDFHRESRINLYEKLEKFLSALGWHGRGCVLRILCETGRAGQRQGNFLEEILKATFTLPYGKMFENEHHKEYDAAHNQNGHCAEMYPDCEELYRLKILKNKVKDI